MADDLGSKVDFILNKLIRSDSIEGRLQNLNKSVADMEESFAIIEKDVEVLKEKTEKTGQKVKDLEESVDYHDQDIGDLQRDVKGLRHDVISCFKIMQFRSRDLHRLKKLVLETATLFLVSSIILPVAYITSVLGPS